MFAAGKSALVLAMIGAGLAGCARDRASSAPSGGDAPAAEIRGAPAPEPQRAIAAGPRDLGGGLTIEDLIPGDGPECPAGATAVVNFTAAFGGTIYDSSAMRKRPLTLPLSSPSLIEGLKRGVPGMKVGGTRRIEIPWRLAYGEAGRDPIPPRTDLVFEVELLEVRK